MKTTLLVSLLALGISANVGATTLSSTAGGNTSTVTALTPAVILSNETASFDSANNSGSASADCLVQANDGSTRDLSAQWTGFTHSNGASSAEWAVDAMTSGFTNVTNATVALAAINDSADLATGVGNVNETGTCGFSYSANGVPTAGDVEIVVNFTLS